MSRTATSSRVPGTVASTRAGKVRVSQPAPKAGPSAYHVVVTAARDELRRLVDDLPEAQVSAALVEVQRLAAAAEPPAWPPPWFGAVKSGRPDISERVDELLAERFGR